MKILHLQKELNLSCGVTKSILLIVKNSSPVIHHQIIALGGNGVSRFTAQGINPQIIKNSGLILFKSIKIFFILTSFCKRNKIDIIHSHHRYFDFLAFVISRIINVKTVMSVQSKVFKRKLFSYKSKILIAVSVAIKNHLIKEFLIDEKRIKLINNFIDPNEILTNDERDFNRNDLGFCDNDFILTFIGRFSKEKGVDILLNAINKIQLNYNEVILLMIGEGEEKDQIDNTIRSNNINAKILPSTEKIYKYYLISDLIVLPSRTDPFPVVMLEAGLCKKPFIGSKVDGIAEFIEDGISGLLFNSEELDGLIDAIVKIIKDKNYANDIAKNLNEKVLNNCQVTQLLPKLEKVYSEISNVS
ncbi:MAG: glycosyltransferase family 4 protein [Ignavibacteria bacterium]|nr:glycosyltransferase family 4 protein [Ignavibacteria bacterium]MBT8392348.1 glycosyltransferase family 4 protein [Ignavibacteria bacterium]NNL22228.1 glycosyltransferase family 4 protein [Ignavibacteriaceae bacterium]